MSTPTAYWGSSPEAVQTINVNQTIVPFSEVSGLRFITQFFSIGGVELDGITTATALTSSDSGYSAYLAYTPIADSVELGIGSAVQPDDRASASRYTISGRTITLNFTPAATDLIWIRYLRVSDSGIAAASTTAVIPIGTAMWFSEADVPSGWAICDGVTEYSYVEGSEFAPLYAVLSEWDDAQGNIIMGDGQAHAGQVAAWAASRTFVLCLYPTGATTTFRCFKA